MVGDQQQLPATVFSKPARSVGYDRSLFQRLIETGHPYLMLDTQYRMFPIISAYASRVFYRGQLRDGENVKEKRYLPVFIKDKLEASNNNNIINNNSYYNNNSSSYNNTTNLYLKPLMFFNLSHSAEITGPSGSQRNPTEAVFCKQLLHTILYIAKQYTTTCNSSSTTSSSMGSIGIITFYQDQLAELRNTIKLSDFQEYSSSTSTCKITDIELNTVDGFQGKEKDIIIISTVRSNNNKNVGFTADKRRINVALTRAKKGLFIIGNSDTLQNNYIWKGYINEIKEKKECSYIDIPAVQQCDLCTILWENLNDMNLSSSSENFSVVGSSGSSSSSNTNNNDNNNYNNNYNNSTAAFKKRKRVRSKKNPAQPDPATTTATSTTTAVSTTTASSTTASIASDTDANTTEIAVKRPRRAAVEAEEGEIQED